LGEERRQPRLVVESLAEQVRLHAARRRGERCELLVEQLDGWLAEATCGNDHYRAMREIAHARMRMATRDFDVARAALLAARSFARKAGRTRDWLEARVLLVLVSEPDDVETVASLRESLSIAEANGLVRLFADAHPQLLDIVRTFAASRPLAETGASSSFLDRVLGREHAAATQEPARRERVIAQALLTAKEAAILEMLSAGMTNKEIARAADLGLETVKWHLKNLFGKLDAGGRRHAVDRARAMGLLST
jgi:LuxR family maltose regulon positive regulatory protein